MKSRLPVSISEVVICTEDVRPKVSILSSRFSILVDIFPAISLSDKTFGTNATLSILAMMLPCRSDIDDISIKVIWEPESASLNKFSVMLANPAYDREVLLARSGDQVALKVNSHDSRLSSEAMSQTSPV